MQPLAQEFPSGSIKFYLILSYLKFNMHCLSMHCCMHPWPGNEHCSCPGETGPADRRESRVRERADINRLQMAASPPDHCVCGSARGLRVAPGLSSAPPPLLLLLTRCSGARATGVFIHSVVCDRTSHITRTHTHACASLHSSQPLPSKLSYQRRTHVKLTRK